ncbi:Chain length determinant protein [Roseovarius gaetbuli]|uniref:Chain length determinant protein n=2 Tax=Roseovarius gaetbuli TaxID=1356575 RepID=A0A1X6Z7P8_9RHOB|nr:Chain length determinant protein [Roseovarius gaetbuli]
MGSIQSLPGLYRMLRRRLWLIAFVTLAGSVGAVFFALNQPRAYEATAVIQIETPQVGRDITGRVVPTDAMQRLQLIEQRLMARDNLIKVIDKHALFADAPNMPLPQKIFNLRISTRIEQISVGLQGVATTPSGLSVTVRLGDAQKAADIANEFVDTVLTQNRERRLALVRETLGFYSAEEERVSAQIAAVEADIAEFKRANADALPENAGALRTQLNMLNETTLEIERQIIALQIDSSRQRQEVFARQVEQLTDQRNLVGARIARIEDAIAAAPRVERELGALLRSQTQLQEQLNTITRNRVEAEMSSVLENSQQQERFEILETAIPPAIPVSTSRKKLALMGGVASLLAGLGLAFLLEIMNPALRTAAQLEQELDITPVVTIPVVRLRHERRKQAAKAIGAFILALISLPFILRFIHERVIPLRILGNQ